MEVEAIKYETYGEGDTYLIPNIFDKPEKLFEQLIKEVPLGEMRNQGSLVPRLICVQRDNREGRKPLYRHPYDGAPPESDWTPTTAYIRDRLDEITGQKNNHCLVQLYQDGKSFIGPHTDKTLDIVPGTCIINVSLGAERVMVLDNKTTREKQRISLQHNSALLFGLNTNRKWKHSVKMDKRPDNIKTPEELAFGGQRISLTFRAIGTFVDGDGKISGQGAYKGTDEPDKREQQETMLIAFGQENGDPHFDWAKYYSRGFSVVDFSGLQ